MPATYNHHVFETPLLAQWAAFFDLVGWRWSTNVEPVANWQPDLRVTFACGHSECEKGHALLISVLPIDDLDGIKGHPALRHQFQVVVGDEDHHADAGAVFGSNPRVAEWQMAHGAGGGVFQLDFFVDEADKLWRQAASKVRS